MKSRNSELLKLCVNEQTALWLWVIVRSRLKFVALGFPEFSKNQPQLLLLKMKSFLAGC